MKHGLLIAMLPISLAAFFVLSTNKRAGKSGEQYIYTWQSKTVGYNDIQRLYQADTGTIVSFFNRKTLQQFQVNINCRIKKTVVSRDDKGELASFQIVDPAIEVAQLGQAVDCDLIKEELGHPVFAEISPQGLIKKIRVDTAIADFSADMIKGILSRLQYVKPMKKINEWQVAEENASGGYLARYRQVKSHTSGFVFEKKNEGYTKLKFPGRNQRLTDDGQTNISTDTAGTVLGINTAERQVVQFGSDTVALSSSVISVVLRSTSEVSYEEVEPLTELISSPNYNHTCSLGEALSEEMINRMVYTKTLGTDNLASLKEAMSMQDEKEEKNLILKFRALAYLFPDQCQQLGRLLKKEPLASYTFRVLSSALAYTETEAALNALASVIDARRTEKETVIQLLPLVATYQTPTEQAVSIVKELAFSPASTPEIASTAQLALGGMAYNFKKANEKRSGEITAFLLDKMKEEKDTVQKILVLSNTGSAKILAVLKTYIEHPGSSKEVRMAAISGFRLMSDSSSVTYLTTMINSKDTSIIAKVKEVIAFKKEEL